MMTRGFVPHRFSTPLGISLGTVVLLCMPSRTQAFTHNDCTRRREAQFSFPDCYLPSLNSDVKLSEAHFLMSHDAATGYLDAKHGVSGATNLYAKNQIGSLYDQLDDGARALDIRPKLLNNGTLVAHHGAITIPVSMRRMLEDVRSWAEENPDELVLIFHFHFAFDSGVSYEDYTATSLLADFYDSLGVTYVQCEDLYGFTVGEAMELAQLSSGNKKGHVLALDRQDTYTSSCAKMNYVSNQIVTCYPAAKGDNNNQATIPCTNSQSSSFEDLKNYVMASAHNEATDSNSQLGPPASWDYYPFNAIQALWQVDTHAATMGIAHVSSLIDDNTKSHLNARVVDWIYEGSLTGQQKDDGGRMGMLLMVDHVQLNGNALLSVLRNTCGQSILSDECGQAVAKPQLQRKPMSTLSFLATCFVYGIFGVWLACMFRHYRKHFRHDEEVVPRMKQDLQCIDDSFQRVIQGEFS